LPASSALQDIAAALKRGDKQPLSQSLADLERAPDSAATLTLLDEAWDAPIARTIGLTGPPGVGKSTLAGALIRRWRDAGHTVGVIAVDPSSRKSGGALLGDRTRLRTDPEDSGVFIRSMAARDRLGGLADLTFAGMVLMRALFDRVLVETVGVGQSETDVADCTDTVLFCVQPGSGDSLQFMKAGIVEIPDIVAVTKADLGAAADRARSDVAGAMSLAPGQRPSGDWSVPVLAISAQTGQGLDSLDSALDAHADWLAAAARLAERRQRQAETWTRAFVRNQFGREGLNRLGDFEYPVTTSPFRRAAALAGGAGGDSNGKNGK
jgi:LAO/AO transport system kinase